ncbi:MAG: flagellar basal-body MS-ring/collar protein FliF [Pseudomonadota bacterium]
MNGLSELINKIGLLRLAAVIGVTGGVAAALMAIMLRLGEPPMGLLFAGLELEDAQEVTQYLDQANIPYQLRSGGSAILAPSDQVMNLRMTLASEGLPAGGTVGYEIFDKSEGLGASAFQQNINRLRALEGELARTIRSIGAVRAARVHLVIPERELFSREKKEPSASIVVEVGRGGLDAKAVRAIQNLAASAVPGLKPDQVTILDNQGNLLARAVTGEAGEDVLAANMHEERTAATEARIRRAVETLVASIVGEDNVRVQVSAEIDFSRVTESSEIYDPDGQVILSTTTIEDVSNSQNTQNDETVSVANNLPEAEQGDAPGRQSSNNNRRTEEVVNYEISKTVRNAIQETGEVERLSVAVAVNGRWEASETGEESYVPRTEEEMQRITALVRSAMGYVENRDQIEVVNMEFPRFAAPEAEPEKQPFLGLTKDDILRIVEVAVLGLIGLVLIFFVLRPFLAGGKGDADGGQLALAGAGAAALPAGGAQAQLPAPAGDGVAQIAQGAAGPDGVPALPPPGAAPANEFQEQFDIAQIQGQVKASSVKKVSEIVDKHPEESLAILRSWLHEG